MKDARGLLEAEFGSTGERKAFWSWASYVAGELSGYAGVSTAGLPTEDPAACVELLLRAEMLGPGEVYDFLPGFYADAGYGDPGEKKRAGEDLLYYLYHAAFADLEDGETALRVRSGCETESDEGWVIGYDPTGRTCAPQGLILFREERVRLVELVCQMPADLLRVYRGVEKALG